MRLCSVYFESFHPFDSFPIFTEFVYLNNVNDLMPGDCLVVWGGADIWPGYYGKLLSPKSGAYHYPTRRDMTEWEFMQRAKELGVPIIGICRGAQMLCALAGGYLIQHISGHSGTHPVITPEGEEFTVNSIHHQMMVPVSPDGSPVPHTIVAEVPKTELRSSVYWDEDNMVDHKQEPEFIHFNNVKGYAIQWHPEMMPSNCRATQFISTYMEKTL